MSIRKSLKSILARADRVEALFAIDVVRDHRNQVIPTLTLHADKQPTAAQGDRLKELLNSMAALLREVYGPKK